MCGQAFLAHRGLVTAPIPIAPTRSPPAIPAAVAHANGPTVPSITVGAHRIAPEYEPIFEDFASQLRPGALPYEAARQASILNARQDTAADQRQGFGVKHSKKVTKKDSTSPYVRPVTRNQARVSTTVKRKPKPPPSPASGGLILCMLPVTCGNSNKDGQFSFEVSYMSTIVTRLLRPACVEHAWRVIDPILRASLAGKHVALAGGRYERPKPLEVVVRTPQTLSWHLLRPGNSVQKLGIIGTKCAHHNYNHIKVSEAETFTGEELRTVFTKDRVNIVGVGVFKVVFVDPWDDFKVDDAECWDDCESPPWGTASGRSSCGVTATAGTSGPGAPSPSGETAIAGRSHSGSPTLASVPQETSIILNVPMLSQNAMDDDRPLPISRPLSPANSAGDVNAFVPGPGSQTDPDDISIFASMALRTDIVLPASTQTPTVIHPSSSALSPQVPLFPLFTFDWEPGSQTHVDPTPFHSSVPAHHQPGSHNILPNSSPNVDEMVVECVPVPEPPPVTLIHPRHHPSSVIHLKPNHWALTRPRTKRIYCLHVHVIQPEPHELLTQIHSSPARPPPSSQTPPSRTPPTRPAPRMLPVTQPVVWSVVNWADIPQWHSVAFCSAAQLHALSLTSLAQGMIYLVKNHLNEAGHVKIRDGEPLAQGAGRRSSVTNAVFDHIFSSVLPNSPLWLASETREFQYSHLALPLETSSNDQPRRIEYKAWGFLVAANIILFGMLPPNVSPVFIQAVIGGSASIYNLGFLREVTDGGFPELLQWLNTPPEHVFADHDTLPMYVRGMLASHPAFLRPARNTLNGHGTYLHTAYGQQLCINLLLPGSPYTPYNFDEHPNVLVFKAGFDIPFGSTSFVKFFDQHSPRILSMMAGRHIVNPVFWWAHVKLECDDERENVEATQSLLYKVFVSRFERYFMMPGHSDDLHIRELVGQHQWLKDERDPALCARAFQGCTELNDELPMHIQTCTQSVRIPFGVHIKRMLLEPYQADGPPYEFELWMHSQCFMGGDSFNMA
ncbi:hypothetical protein M422DRAFT_48448 [Sphaerobolus stellatus SS14]|uniref:HECT domain-containing protein n=1 Tax=Sphaerobolus stellatus (strain SS14) TaxID=990650 RepID=A0A0C9VUR7_SPHS4|nr:hypothetical protein M422DRAFT_48448 [Sphaerobolus stellatus SS14]